MKNPAPAPRQSRMEQGLRTMRPHTGALFSGRAPYGHASGLTSTKDARTPAMRRTWVATGGAPWCRLRPHDSHATDRAGGTLRHGAGVET
ncbi:hypothetical protein [Komagataeibacter diospyri]|uniref:hypothetical protein n=1 Tax=Komagataeibacter diospyri TaxID=1932662 RepID=UPI0037563322